MEIVSSILLLIFIFTLGFLMFFRKSRKKLPPGPKGLPFIGNAFQIDPHYAHLQFSDLAKKYGDVFKITMFGNDIVILSGENQIRNALITNSEAFAGRPPFVRMTVVNKNGITVTFADFSEKWARLKKSAMNCLKMYGTGLQRLEAMATEMCNDLAEKFMATGGEAFDPDDHVHFALSEIMFSLAFGFRPSEEEMKEFIEFVCKLVPTISVDHPSSILELLPWLQYFNILHTKRVREMADELENILSPHIEKRKEMFDGGAPECVLDVMIKHNMENKDVKYGLNDMVAVMQEVFGAGIKTSSAVLYHFFAQCVATPELQRKIQDEIDAKIGQRLPLLSDKANMPYLEATIFETLRFLSQVPLIIPHKTTREVLIDDYTIPKDTQVFINVWSLHHDERYWDEPWVFKPERFLTPEGRMVRPDHPNRKRLIPFGAGRRVCIGEGLAKGRLFILIATLLQRFNILPGEDEKIPETDPRNLKPGLVLHPKPYKIRMVPREK